MDAQVTQARQLRSNGFILDGSSARLGELRPSEATSALSGLRARFDRDGYLWLRDFLPRDEVLEFRRQFFTAFVDTGLIGAGTDPSDGIYSNQPYDGELAHKRLTEIVRSAAYESFCLHPRLWRFMDAFVGGPSYLHKRKLIRYTRPGDVSATGAHYDLTYLRAGTDKFVTAWIPIGDIPVAMGGLAYLDGSHAFGRAMEGDFSKANAHLPAAERISAYNKSMNDNGWITKDLPALADRFDARWLVADYAAGDVVLH